MLERIEHILRTIQRMEQHIMSSLENLTAEVSDTKSVIASAITLINGFSARLDAAIAAAKAGDNSAALDQLSSDLKASTDALAGAVAANTPAAAPAPAPADAPAAPTLAADATAAAPTPAAP